MTRSGGDRRRFFADKFFFTPSPTKNRFELRSQEVAAMLEKAISQAATNPASANSLAETVLRGATLANLVLVDAVLHDIDLTGANLDGAIFLRVDLKNAQLSHASFVGAIFEQCDLQNANMQFCKGSKSWLNGNFSKVDFHSADLMDSVLSGDFRESSFVGANLETAWIQDADLRGIDFNNASLAGCTTWNTTMDATIRFPDGHLLRSVMDDIGRFTNPNHPNFWKPENKDFA